MDADDRQPLAPGAAQARVDARDVALDARLVEQVEADDRARPAGARRAGALLDRAVHRLEVGRRVAGAVPRLLRLVVDLVPGAEVAHAEVAEVGHDPPGVGAVRARRDEAALLGAQVGGRDVHQRRDPGRARREHVRARPQALGHVLHDVGRHEVARALDLQRPPVRRREHRRALIGDGDADRAARTGRGRRHGRDGQRRGAGQQPARSSAVSDLARVTATGRAEPSRPRPARPAAARAGAARRRRARAPARARTPRAPRRRGRGGAAARRASRAGSGSRRASRRSAIRSPASGPVGLGDGDRAAQLDDRRAGDPRELAVQRGDLRPVARLVGVQRRDRRLHDVGPRPRSASARSSARAARGDLRRVPQRAVLVGEQHDLAVAQARLAARVVQQHQRQQAVHLGLVGHQLGERAPERAAPRPASSPRPP